KNVKNWFWEVWNEPDIPYWHGTLEEYNRLYDVTAAAIRQVLPSARIGGPETTRPSGAKAGAFLSQFLEHCARGRNAATGGVGAPLDFISFHPKGSPKFVDGHVRMGIATQLLAVDRGMEIVASFPIWKNTPIILGESDPEGCAACQGTQNGYRNGPLYGVTIAEATARTYELARKHGVNLLGIVTWAFEFEDQPYFSGFRTGNERSGQAGPQCLSHVGDAGRRLGERGKQRSPAIEQDPAGGRCGSAGHRCCGHAPAARTRHSRVELSR